MSAVLLQMYQGRGERERLFDSRVVGVLREATIPE
jgi:hypothetical protein